MNGRRAAFLMDKCYLPYEERTVTPQGIFPCSIYIRYFGEALCSLDADVDEQQKSINRFITEHKCINDKICFQNCTQCTKAFNLEVNRNLRDINSKREVRTMDISLNTIDDQRRFWARKVYEILKNYPRGGGYPYMLIKPDAYDKKDEIIGYILNQNIGIFKVVPIPNWKDVSLFLYAKYNKERSLPDIRFHVNKAHSVLQSSRAYLIILEKDVPSKKIMRIKHDIREWFGELMIRIILPDGSKVAIWENFIHSPDPDDLDYEYGVLSYFVKGVG
ncbi:hypothetical protein KAU32_07260 [bacterium]|nr:hypothetical protein [bacterium]